MDDRSHARAYWRWYKALYLSPVTGPIILVIALYAAWFKQ